MNDLALCAYNNGKSYLARVRATRSHKDDQPCLLTALRPFIEREAVKQHHEFGLTFTKEQIGEATQELAAQMREHVEELDTTNGGSYV